MLEAQYFEQVVLEGCNYFNISSKFHIINCSLTNKIIWDARCQLTSPPLINMLPTVDEGVGANLLGLNLVKEVCYCIKTVSELNKINT
jgi:hypothetical protein